MIGTRPYLLSPPSLRGFGTILAWLADRLEAPESAEGDWTPPLTDDRAFEEYGKPDGIALLFYLSAKRDQPTLTLADAWELTSDIDEAFISLLVESVFIRSRRKSSDPEAAPSKKPQRGKGLEQIDFAVLMADKDVCKFPPHFIADLSIDQFEILLTGGRPEPEDTLSFDEVMAIYRKATGRE